MGEEQQTSSRYTTIIHQVRLSLELSCNEYCVADIIFHLSSNPTAKVQGWCYASKDTIADFMGLHRTVVYRIIEKLISLGLVEKDEDTKWLKTTKKWYENIVIERIKYRRSEKLPTVAKSYYPQSQKATPDSSEKLHNNNIDIDNTINSISKEIPETALPKIEIINYLKEKQGIQSLDDSNKWNRIYAGHLLKKFGDSTDKVKRFVDFALADPFHKKNATSIKYLYNNINKIALSYKGKAERHLQFDE